MHTMAERVINKLGGARKVADMLGLSRQAVYKWTYPMEYNGTGGLIPHRRQLELMVAAKQRGIILEAEDFFPRMPDDKKTKVQGSQKGRQDD